MIFEQKMAKEVTKKQLERICCDFAKAEIEKFEKGPVIIKGIESGDVRYEKLIGDNTDIRRIPYDEVGLAYDENGNLVPKGKHYKIKKD